MPKPVRLNLRAINKSLQKVEKNWQSIDDKLDELKIGRKDTPFDSALRERMMTAYEYLDMLLRFELEPFDPKSDSHMIELNNCVHYGEDSALRSEYHRAISAAAEKFYEHIGVLAAWYEKHEKKKDPPLKIAAEIYVGIIGRPQLFVEGNHRTGSLIASWIDLYHGFPPFVLSEENAIAYFAPSSEIKHFTDKSTWRGRLKLPKYKRSFGQFWKEHVDDRYILK